MPLPSSVLATCSLYSAWCVTCRGLTRVFDDALGLLLGLGEHLLALLDDPPGLLDLLGDGGPHLVEDVVDLLLVDAHLVGQRHGLGVVHQVVELVYEYEDIHLAATW